MTDFQRTRSKVWFPSPDDDDEDVLHHRQHLHPPQKQQQHHRVHSWRRQPSSSPESRRVSSGSPSNGSHRSQDSGFSDSESGGSPPASSSAGAPSRTVAAATAAVVRSFGDRSRDDDEEDDDALAVAGTISPSRFEPSAEPCDCLLPACELSRKFRSYRYGGDAVAPDAALSPFAPNAKRHAEEQRTPNRTCFIVDELPKNGSDGGAMPQQLSTPSSTKSFDGHFDRSENVTVVENVCNDGQDDGDGRQLIIDPPTPFVDRADEADSLSDAPPEHTSTPKSSKNRCCTPKMHCRKELQLRKPKNTTVDCRTECENQIPVGQWLNELRLKYEPECMNILQSKSIATSEDDCRISTIVCTDSKVIQDLYHRTKAVSDEFKRVYDDLNKCRNDNFGPSVQKLTGLLLDFVCDHESDLPENSQGLCMDMVDVSEKLRIHANRRPGNRKIILNDISALGQIFSELIDALLMKTIQSLINVLEEPSTDIELIKAMSSINTMGLESLHLSCLVMKCNGIRSLLAVCLDAVSSTVRSAALRTLALVCCTSDSIRQFEKDGGVEVLSDILDSGNMRPEKELADAVSVLVQITAPWIEDDNHFVNGLSEHLETLVSSLTHLVETTRSSETLLLSAAALANMTSMEPKSVWTVLNMGTAGCLVEAVRRNGTASSVFLQEQTAALLANMSAVPETRPHMAANRAVVALLCFLQVRHSPLQPVAEILAAERLQHKAAIALSRLCSDMEVSKQVVELEGVNRLIRLCKDERERNYSDGVLVACLASLRKIAANCGKDNIAIMNGRDAAELIEPRLLDSFLLHSSKQESYV